MFDRLLFFKYVQTISKLLFNLCYSIRDVKKFGWSKWRLNTFFSSPLEKTHKKKNILPNGRMKVVYFYFFIASKWDSIGIMQ